MTKKQKLEWIQALEDTIKRYENGHLPGKHKDCPLCLVTMGSTDIYKCITCIHLSEFGQGFKCTEHLSFPETKRLLPYRIHYLKTIIKRIQKSME